MDDERFDDLTRRVASPLSRARLLKGVAAAVAGAALGRFSSGEAQAKVNPCTEMCVPIQPCNPPCKVVGTCCPLCVCPRPPKCGKDKPCPHGQYCCYPGPIVAGRPQKGHCLPIGFMCPA